MIVTKISLFKEKISLIKININKLSKIIIDLRYLAILLCLKINIITAKELIMFHKFSNKKISFKIMIQKCKEPLSSLNKWMFNIILILKSIKKKKSYLMNR